MQFAPSVRRSSTTALVPVLNAPETALQAHHFLRECNFGRVLFVCSENDTHRTAETLTRAGGAVVVAPAEADSKAAQLNWAIRQGISTTWCTIFDVDSRPESLSSGGSLSPDDGVHVVASCTRYEATSGSRFWSGLASAQTFWSTSIEGKRWLTKSRVAYVVGHGLALRTAFIHGRPFDESAVAEDLRLGYELARDRIPVTLSGDVDVSTVPESAGALIAQVGRWFYGDVQATDALGWPWKWIRRSELVISWLLGPPVFVLVAARYPCVLPILGAGLVVLGSHAAKSSVILGGDERPVGLGFFCGFAARPVLFSAGAWRFVVLAAFSRERKTGFSPTKAP